MNGIFAQRRARLLSMKAVREAGPQASACPGCGAQSDRTVLSRNLWVCPKCGHHFPLDAYSRLKSVRDAGSFRELNFFARSSISFWIESNSSPTFVSISSSATTVFSPVSLRTSTA